MHRVKVMHLLEDSKIHILAISTLLCVKVFSFLAIGGSALLYSLLPMWMIVDYKVSLMLRTSKTVLLSFVIPALVVCAVKWFIIGDALFISAIRLMLVTLLVMLVYDLLRLRSAKTLGLVMAVVIEILVPLKEQYSVFVAIIASCVIGIVVTLFVAFVYYTFVDYSAYLKYKKKEYNEEAICAMFEMQLKQFFLGKAVDWELLRVEILEFKDNRFFYNKSQEEGNKTELFYDLVIELYCILRMLKNFSSFDNDTLIEAKKIFGDVIDIEPVTDSGVYYCENISTRSMLLNLKILQDIIAKRVNTYTFKM